MHKVLAGVLLIILIAAGVYVAWPVPRIHVVPVDQTPGDDWVACTMDAKMCPDGSYVGRSGPACEFAPCPAANTP